MISLTNYFETNFALMQHHKYSLTELENMLPWEREVYVSLLVNYLKEEKERKRVSRTTEKIMAEEIKDVKVATPKQKVQVDLEVDTSIKDLCKSICKINSYGKEALTLENISKIVFNSLHNSIIQMCNLVYGLTGTYNGTKWVNQYRCWCWRCLVWFIHRYK